MLVKKNKTKVNRIVVISIFVMLATIFCFLFILNTEPVLAQGADLLYGGQEGNIANTIGLSSEDPRIIIAKIIRVFLGFLGIIALFIIIYSGWMWMTSEGSPERVDLAKKILKNGLIGLVIILTSFGIVSFLINRLLGATGGGLGQGGGPPSVPTGFGAIGSCTVESVYPAPYQEDVPRNTSIIVTFKEEVNIDTICNDGNSDGDCLDSGELIIPANVRIYKTIDSSSCEPPAGPCAEQLTNVQVDVTPDNKTFVFILGELLGSPSENIDYTVYLTNDIEKVNWTTDLDRYIFGTCSPQYLEWRFEVSNEIDLDPPIVKNGGIFPRPDNSKDNFMVSSPAVQATGIITVLNQPDTRNDASVISVINTGAGTWSTASDTNLDVNCEEDALHVTVYSDLSSELRRDDASGPLLGPGTISGGDTVVSFSYCDLELIIDNNDFNIECGGNCLWDVDIDPVIYADTLTVASILYEFGADIPLGIDTAGTAGNITVAINNNLPALLDASQAGNVVNLTADIAGASGNNINLDSSNSANVEITNPMSGGEDAQTTTIIYGQKDQPRNSVIQINFNEAINPLTVSGDAETLYAAYPNLAIKCVEVDEVPCALGPPEFFDCGGEVCLKGIFEVSNQYRTLEFRSLDLCGINGCGENIYCLPPNSKLKVELKASTLDACAGASDCASKLPYDSCNPYGAGNVCQNSAGRNYPLSETPLDGVMDAALNSLDGDRSSDTIGEPDAEGNSTQNGQSPYFENETIASCAGATNPGRICTLTDAVALCGVVGDCEYADGTTVVALATRIAFLQGTDGDDYEWLFYVSNVLDLNPPVIDNINPVHLGSGASLLDPVDITFNYTTPPQKLMMSSSLRTGQVDIQSGTNTYTHKYINIKSYSGQPIGYWISKTDVDDSMPLDGYPDYTVAHINHSDFYEATSYKSQVGSGAKDIYQNCFKPSSGITCAADDTNPSCCGLVPSVNCPAW